MKRILLTPFLLSLLFVVGSFSTPGTGIFVLLPASEDPIPPLNQKVIEFVQSNMKKKVGRGECWDLAAEALDHAGATWDHKYKFGTLVDQDKEIVFPGDIVQFENVFTRDKSGNVAREETMPKHTAIIYRVIDKGVYDIAHQNTDITGRKVGLSRFVMDHVVRGTVSIYRPAE